jgi:hypothetical protein
MMIPESQELHALALAELPSCLAAQRDATTEADRVRWGRLVDLYVDIISKTTGTP